MSLAPGDLSRRVDLDPRAEPATYSMKWDDGVFLDYALSYVGTRNPTENEKLLLADAFLAGDVGYFNFWGFEMLSPPAPEDRFRQAGVLWIVRAATQKLFRGDRYRVLCMKARAQ